MNQTPLRDACRAKLATYPGSFSWKKYLGTWKDEKGPGTIIMQVVLRSGEENDLL